jgi:serine/threonine protein kinase
MIDSRTPLSVESSGYFLSSGYHRLATVNLPPNTVLDGRFRVLNRLGSGATAAVYLAEDQMLKARVAAKVFEASGESESEILPYLRLEKQVLDRVGDHTHLRKVHDVHPCRYRKKKLLLLTMEYIEGETLLDWLVRSRTDLPTRTTQGLEILLQIVQGLRTLVDSGILPIDVTPRNVLLCGEQAKISDPTGIIVGETPAGFLTPSGLGTPAYLAPEVLATNSFQELDVRSVIYSFGLVALQVLHPRGGEMFDDAWAEGRCRSPFDWKPDLCGVEPSLQPILSRCLEAHPRDRYQDLVALLEDLQEARDKTLVPETVEPTPEEKIAEILKVAEKSIDRGDWGNARGLAESALDLSPSHPKARAILAEIEVRSSKAEDFLQEARRRLDDGRLGEAAVHFKEAAEVYLHHPKALSVLVSLETRKEQYVSLLRKANRLVRDRMLDPAAHLFQQAAEINRGEVSVQEAARVIAAKAKEVSDLRTAISVALADGNAARARALADLVDQVFESIHIKLGGDREDEDE